MKIGFIGQGFVGKSTADDLQNRGYEVVRYSLEEEYKNNVEEISDCGIVFIGVPTPTTKEGFDDSIVKEVLALVSDGSIAVIKSTLIPGTTAKLQDLYKNKIVLFSPEFLSEKTAAYDAANPIMNILGLPVRSPDYFAAAEKVMDIMPTSKNNFIVSSQSAEILKYAHNLNGYMRVILSNLLFDVSEKTGADWDDVGKMMDSDVMMSPYYNYPVHKGGRGAGGNCFIKDMAAFRSMYEKVVPEDVLGLSVLKTLEDKNIDLLNKTGKDKHIVASVYNEKD